MNIFFKKNQGFTLIEIIITTVIFVAALIPILSLYQAGFIGSADTEIMTKCLNLARAKMEETKNFRYEYIDVEDNTIDVSGNELKNVNTFFTDEVELKRKKTTSVIKRIVCVEYVDRNNHIISNDVGLKKITVIVFVKERNKFKKKIELVTLRSRYF